MSIDEQKDAVVKKSGELWSKFGRYVYIGVGVLAFIIGAVWVGQWWAQGKADEFAKSIHDKWMITDGRALYDNIAIQRNKIEELDQNYTNQKAALEDARKKWGKEIGNVIRSQDTTTIAGAFDNLIDGYIPPPDWDK